MAKRPTTAKGKSAAKPATAGDKGPAEAPAVTPSAGAAPKSAPGTAGEVPRRSRAVLWLAGAVIIAGAGFLVWARMAMPPAEAPADDPATVALEARLNGFDDRLAALERRLDTAGVRIGELESRAEAAPDVEALAGLAVRLDGAGDALAALEGRIAAVETRFAALAEVAPGDAAVALDLSALEARLAALESAPGMAPGTAPGSATDDGTIAAVQDEAARLAALAGELGRRLAVLEARPVPAGAEAGTLLAVAQLRAALARSGAFEAELSALRTIAGEDDPAIRAALAALAPHAAAGIPTLAMLRARFAALADEVVRAGYAPPEGGWLKRTFARLSELVTVRRVGDDVAGATPEAIVARAEARLAAGDLAAALAEAEALDGAPAEVLADWLGDARARLAAERALATLDSRAVAALAGG